jgi:hypothetical protein
MRYTDFRLPSRSPLCRKGRRKTTAHRSVTREMDSDYIQQLLRESMCADIVALIMGYNFHRCSTCGRQNRYKRGVATPCRQSRCAVLARRRNRLIPGWMKKIKPAGFPREELQECTTQIENYFDENRDAVLFLPPTHCSAAQHRCFRAPDRFQNSRERACWHEAADQLGLLSLTIRRRAEVVMCVYHKRLATNQERPDDELNLKCRQCPRGWQNEYGDWDCEIKERTYPVRTVVICAHGVTLTANQVRAVLCPQK